MPKRSVRDRPVRAETAPSRILGARWPPRNTTTTSSSASRGPRRTPRSSAPSASSPSSGTPTSARTRPRRSGSRRSTRPTRSCPTRSGVSGTTLRQGRRRRGGGPGFEGFGGFSDIFDAFFGGGQAPAPPGAAGRSPARTCATTCGSRSRRRSRAPSKEIEFRASSSRCETCHGTGAKPGTEAVTCPQCDGRGEVRSVRQTMLGQMVNVAACPRCHGEGKIIETPCETCKGDGRTERKRTLRVTIPAGIDEGHQIRLSNEGEVGPRGGPPGSLYVAVHVAEHPTLKRDGTELYFEADRVDRPGGARDEDHGPDRRRRGGGRDQARDAARHRDPPARQGRAAPAPGGLERGDLHVLVDVVVPTKLTKRQRELLDRAGRRGAGEEVARRPAAAARSSGWG